MQICCTFWSIFATFASFFWFSLISLPYDKKLAFIFQTPLSSMIVPDYGKLCPNFWGKLKNSKSLILYLLGAN